MVSSTESFFSDLFINFENSSILTPNFINESHSYFSKAELGQYISIKATCDGSIPLKDIPSTDASNVASSTNVDIAEVMAFHSSGDFVLATKVKLIHSQAVVREF